jgi:hypothetical protein
MTYPQTVANGRSLPLPILSVSIVSLAYYAGKFNSQALTIALHARANLPLDLLPLDLICTATRSMVYEGDGTDYEPTDAGTAGGTVRSLPAEQFDPMAIQNKIEKGGNFNSVQWYVIGVLLAR